MSEARCKEEVFIAECFALLSRFANDKLKDFIEKEKSRKTQRSQEVSLWNSFLNRLVCFGDLEKAYSMAFLGTSNISRFLSKKEDNLKGQYASLLSDIRTIANNIIKQQKTSSSSLNSTRSNSSIKQSPTITSKSPTNTPRSTTTTSKSTPTTSHSSVSVAVLSEEDLNQLVYTMLNQLEHFILARTNILLFYGQMPTENFRQPLVTEDLLRIIISTTDELKKHITNHLLLSLKETYVMECISIQHLLTAQSHLQRPLYLESLLCLLSASNHLNAWSAILCNNKQSKKPSFVTAGSKGSTNLPELFCWLSKLKNLLLSKFTFYFFEVLISQGGNQPEMKNLLAKSSCDFYSRLITFSKKLDTVVVMMVSKSLSSLDAHNHGYTLPDNNGVVGGSVEIPDFNDTVSNSSLPVNISSKSSFVNYQHSNNSSVNGSSTKEDSDDSKRSSRGSTPGSSEKSSISQAIFFSHPHERPSDALLRPLQELFGQKPHEVNNDKVNYHCANNLTYVVMKVEGDIYLVSVLNKRLNKTDNKINNFYTAFCSDLRCCKHFNNIKSGVK